jgi:O-antigen/teichoic acid export membrane protein
MIQKIRGLRSDTLVKGGIILFTTIVIYNLLNYAFQISMAKMLGPAEYSVLAVLMSILYIFSIPSESIQTVIAKYISKLNARGELGKMKNLFSKSMKKGVVFALVIFLLLFVLSFFLASFLNINFWLFILMNSLIFYVFISSIMRGVLQGRKRFTAMGASLITEAFIKFLFAILLVVGGWKVFGAVTGVLIGCFTAAIVTFLMLKEILVLHKTPESFVGIYKNSFPILAAMMALVLMYSLDIILARRFFSPEQAGVYAFISLIGKVIIFVSSSIGKALFPISSEEFEKGKATSGLFKKSLLLVALINSFILVLYLLFPNYTIFLVSLGSTQYLGASNILFLVGLASACISFATIIVLYRLSTNSFGKSAYFLLVFVVLQLILFFIYHSTLLEFSFALLISDALLFAFVVASGKK